MVLNKIKTGRAYESASYFAGEAEGVFFSLVRPVSEISYRFGGFSSDPDTEFYKGLIVIGAIIWVGVAGTIVHYLVNNKYRHPTDIASNALENTVDIAGVAVNGAGRVVNTASQNVMSGAKSLRDKLR